MAVCCGERWAIHHPGCPDAPAFLAESIDIARELELGDKVYMFGARQGFTVKARDERYLICTKPFNAQRTVICSILDLERGMCGPDNLVLGIGYETQEQVDESLELLRSGEIEVSSRHGAQLKIDRVVKAAA